MTPLDARRAWDMADVIDRIAASVGRSPEGEDRNGLRAEHEHAVPEGQTPIPYHRRSAGE